MKKKILSLLLTAVTTLLLTGCDKLVSHIVNPDNLDIVDKQPSRHQEVMEVRKVVFSPDHKTFTVTTRLHGDIGPYGLTDSSQTRIDVRSTISSLSIGRHATPRLVSMRNVKLDNISNSGVHALALVNLTLPQEELDKIRNYLFELRLIFAESDLKISFIYGDSITQTIPATPYTLNKYLIQQPEQHALLYRSIAQKYNEMTSRQGAWANVRHMALLVFSGSEAYDEATNMPIDPEHFTYEENLIQISQHPAKNMMIAYADMGHSTNDSNRHETLVLKHLCEKTKGLFMQTYSGTTFKDCLLKKFHISLDANEFTFENPDGKVYCGIPEKLTADFYSVKNDSLIVSFDTVINEGNFYNPIIVNGIPTTIVILQGSLLAALVVLVTWLLLQFLIPYLSYKFFCHKYVLRYTGHNMTFGKNLVSESCYLCKDSFEVGDEIVVKCQHTMHKSCWDENEYHCTEYSDHCKNGTYYYNRKNLTDSRNAPFFMKWIIAGIIATTLAWMLFIGLSHHITNYYITKIVLWFNEVKEGTPEAAALISDNAISPLPTFGFAMGLFLSLAIAVLSTKMANIRYNYKRILLQAVVAALLCYVSFLVTTVIMILTNLQNYAFLLEWIPWVFSAFIIARIGTYGTRVPLRKMRKMRKMRIIPCTAVVLLSMYVWWALFSNNIDYRLTLLIGFVLYGVGLVSYIAPIAPHSERYFLHVQGAVKDMDIALFKWFRNSPERVVTIGKSVNCSLQLSWDVTGDVAPVHAEIRMHRNVPYLIALEEGVVLKKRVLEVGEKVWLSHGLSFTIANTTFTYIEKDLA